MRGLDERITGILNAPKPGAAPQVRTSPAFAARFDAEAKRSGLTVDLEEKDTAELVRVCPTCGAQNARYVSECFNCQSELLQQHQPAQRKRTLPEARWQNILGTPRASTLPLVKVPVVQARFAQQAKTAPVTGSEALGRFLAVFVEREREVPKTVERFDQRSALDKFLSVFVEKA